MEKKRLKEIWNKAVPPDISKMRSTYEVTIHSGPFDFYSKWVWVWEKAISNYVNPKTPRCGKNYINGNYEGFFTITKDLIPGLPKDEVYLNYEKGNRNTGKWNRMVDAIRIVEPGLYIGKIYFRLFGNKFFPTYAPMGFFSLHYPTLLFDKETFSISKKPMDVTQGNHD